MITGPKPYSAYKPCPIPWVGELPTSWQVAPALAAYRPKAIRNVGMREETVLSLSYGRIVVRPVNKPGGLVPDSFETYQIISPGDVVIRTTDMQNDQTSLRVGQSRHRGIITSAYLCLEVRDALIPEYGYQLLNAYDLLKVLYRYGSGLRQNLDYDDIKRMPILIPPPEDQHAVVAFLAHLDQLTRDYFQSLRLAFGLLNEHKGLVQEYRARLIVDVVTGALDVREVAARIPSSLRLDDLTVTESPEDPDGVGFEVGADA
jgi:type I restriction enzyme, S subunit